MGTYSSYLNFRMNALILITLAAAAQSAVILPYHGLTTTYAAGLPLAAAAPIKTTLKYKTIGVEAVDAATPADTKKIELVEKEHEQDVYSHLPYHLGYAAPSLPAVHSYSTIAGLPSVAAVYGLPYGGIIPAAVEAADEPAEEPAVESE